VVEQQKTEALAERLVGILLAAEADRWAALVVVGADIRVVAAGWGAEVVLVHYLAEAILDLEA
jgi:hypothetical protein